MRIACISFTVNGSNLLDSIVKRLKSQGENIKAYTTKNVNFENLEYTDVGVKEWARDNFYSNDALIFIGACGIAVRSIAPYIKNKTVDPCVVSIDEKGEFIIPILSGHIGGGNELAIRIAHLINGRAVISTATDSNNKFAVDVFATKNNFYINDMTTAKKISSAILDGEPIGFFNDFLDDIITHPIAPEQQKQVTKRLWQKNNIHITVKKQKEDNTLNLVPKVVYLGVGCRKNVPSDRMEEFILDTLNEEDIDIHSVKGIYSIALKAKEPCLLDFAKKYNLEFETYSAEKLIEITGVFSTSDFVRNITGVDSVCERCAVKASGNGPLIFKKKAHNGMTLAIALQKNL